MKEVRIEDRRKVIIIQVPEEWIELTGPQFAICCKTYIEPVTDIEFISEFFGIEKSLAKRLDKFQQYKLIELAGFIANPKAMVDFFYLKEIPDTGLQAPGKHLRDVTFEQFMIFDSLFFDYMNEQKDNLLTKFIATLYLNENEKVTGFNIDQRVNFISENVDKSTQYAIFLNYTFIRKWLSKPYPWLFGFKEEDPDEPEKKNLRPKKPNRPDWNAILYGLIGDDIIHYEEYRQIPCTVAFRTINKRIQTYNQYGK